jgi:hypothetical protein
MKTKVILILVLGILIASRSFGQEVLDDLNEIKLNGKVMSVKETSYEAKEINGEISKGEKKRAVITADTYVLFDDKGHKIEVQYLTHDGRLSRKDVIKYDDNGNKIERICYNSDSSIFLRRIFINNHKGQIIEESNYDYDGELQDRLTYKYDDNGNCTEGYLYVDGICIFKGTGGYDDKGHLVELNINDLNNSFSSKAIARYDDRGNRIEEDHYEPNDSLVSKTTLEYDENSNKIVENNMTYKYEYDMHKNWIKRIDFQLNDPHYIIEREVVYY